MIFYSIIKDQRVYFDKKSVFCYVSFVPKLSNIHPVLVRPQFSGNIGAATRAAKAMGLGPLFLIEPHPPLDGEARKFAAGAIKELKKIKSFSNLDSAIKDSVRIFGLSARRREHRSKPIWLEEAVEEALKASSKGTVLFLFGKERTGLENEELDFAQVLVRIKTSSRFKSMNLAQAVMVTAYEIKKQAGAKIEPYDYEPATGEDIECLIQALDNALERRDFFKPNKRNMALRRMRDLFGRAAPKKNEISLFRGMLRCLDEKHLFRKL